MNTKLSIKGFTLAELLVVVGIVSILIAISIPIFAAKVSHASEVACEANRTSLKHNIIEALMLNETEGETPEELMHRLINKNDFRCPDGGVYTLVIREENDILGGGFEIVCSKHGQEELDKTGTRIAITNLQQAVAAVREELVGWRKKNNDQIINGLKANEEYSKFLRKEKISDVLNGDDADNIAAKLKEKNPSISKMEVLSKSIENLATKSAVIYPYYCEGIDDVIYYYSTSGGTGTHNKTCLLFYDNEWFIDSNVHIYSNQIDGRGISLFSNKSASEIKEILNREYVRI